MREELKQIRAALEPFARWSENGGASPRQSDDWWGKTRAPLTVALDRQAGVNDATVPDLHAAAAAITKLDALIAEAEATEEPQGFEEWFEGSQFSLSEHPLARKAAARAWNASADASAARIAELEASYIAELEASYDDWSDRVDFLVDRVNGKNAQIARLEEEVKRLKAVNREQLTRRG